MLKFERQLQQPADFTRGKALTRKPGQIMQWQIGNSPSFVFPIGHLTRKQQGQIFGVHGGEFRQGRALCQRLGQKAIKNILIDFYIDPAPQDAVQTAIDLKQAIRLFCCKAKKRMRTIGTSVALPECKERFTQDQCIRLIVFPVRAEPIGASISGRPFFFQHLHQGAKTLSATLTNRLCHTMPLSRPVARHQQRGPAPSTQTNRSAGHGA